MERSDVDELYFIAPRINVESILRLGILSNARASRVPHSSVAMALIQQRRDGIRVPGARLLHEYANLYVCARNPMMFKLVMTSGPAEIIVLAVDSAVLEGRDVVIADGNASSGYTIFRPSPGGLAYIDRDRVHGNWSGYADERAKWEHKRVKCAEVLVPDLVPADAITRVVAPSEVAASAARSVATDLPVVVAPYVFFGG
ncbi:MAG: DUF4433 domain-containing protein [Chloroflexota bacterium]